MEIKNLALSDSKGHDLEKGIVIRVTSVARKQVGLSLSLSVSCTQAHKLFNNSNFNVGLSWGLFLCLNYCHTPSPGMDVVQGQVCEP